MRLMPNTTTHRSCNSNCGMGLPLLLKLNYSAAILALIKNRWNLSSHCQFLVSFLLPQITTNHWISLQILINGTQAFFGEDQNCWRCELSGTSESRDPLIVRELWEVDRTLRIYSVCSLFYSLAHACKLTHGHIIFDSVSGNHSLVMC